MPGGLLKSNTESLSTHALLYCFLSCSTFFPRSLSSVIPFCMIWNLCLVLPLNADSAPTIMLQHSLVLWKLIFARRPCWDLAFHLFLLDPWYPLDCPEPAPCFPVTQQLLWFLLILPHWPGLTCLDPLLLRWLPWKATWIAFGPSIQCWKETACFW